MSDREDDIRQAIEIGGRANAFDLMCVAADILRGTKDPSPALAAWFGEAVKRIADGDSADAAFGIKRKPGGNDPLAGLSEKIDRDLTILRLVEEARQRGHPTGGNVRTASCFEVAGAELGLSEAAVRGVWYRWATVEDWALQPPPE